MGPVQEGLNHLKEIRDSDPRPGPQADRFADFIYKIYLYGASQGHKSAVAALTNDQPMVDTLEDSLLIARMFEDVKNRHDSKMVDDIIAEIENNLKEDRDN